MFEWQKPKPGEVTPVFEVVSSRTYFHPTLGMTVLEDHIRLVGWR